MTVSELIAELNRVMEEHGDLKVYCADMQAPEIEVAEPVLKEDHLLYGSKYVFIKDGW